ncbi:MAG: farnesyl diphosphate synthase [Alphaproteobacteria bacterium]|jgi:farnesyl diphosphate synthase|nr:farnesyl diphosphate synthase [Alphaproteobacteria bacterium]
MPASVPAKRNHKRAFKARLASVAHEIEDLLQQILGGEVEDGEIARPPRLLKAMRYAVLSGGKRIRPFFVIETARLFDVKPEHASVTAAAVECVHAYSLIHDDLPAMDNDALRRGRPTVHKAFDEATAILAGDALLTFAFELLAREQTHPDPGVRVALVAELARAAGIGGMAGGQLLDLAAEGRFGKIKPGVITEDAVIMLEAMKTGALIRAACGMGAILGQASEDARKALDFYGYALGQAFQIADDLLDREGDPKKLGKKTKKDAAAGKATFIGILGIDGARARLATLVATAEAALNQFGEEAAMLRAAAHFVAERQA